MNRSKKIVGSICALALSSMLFTVPAFAENAQYFFDFEKGTKSVCGSAHKNDGEQNAYISVKRGDNYFIENSSAFGTRVRTLDGRECTNYHVWRTYGDSRRMPYLQLGNAGWEYNLHGQVDSTSQTQWVRIWGYWCP